ncbi:MAG TPA: uroporphyrinogen-III C-methyltransferase [Anaerolineae bacterium]|nr:uroporphyrinogen-III C-methyltransferase [Anaerolineae bacterium]
MTQNGPIYLVGTGPGDPGLLTVKAQALIREADAIVADLLTHARLLRDARPEAELHDIGGRRHGNKKPEPDVIRLLLELARQGKSVVRLWSGDPVVFTKAADELVAARQAGLRVELVPGVTSAIAALAYAGVPVTHWNYGLSFTVVAGYIHADSPLQPDWATLARSETLVILMPTEHLSDLVAKLLAAGRAADTPALLVQNGTLPNQKRILTRLGDLIRVAEAHQVAPPTILALGEVVRLAETLDWFQPGHDYPLLGQRVLVTRPTHQAAEFMAELRALGAEPISFPTIEIRPVEDPAALDQAIRHLATQPSQISPPPSFPPSNLPTLQPSNPPILQPSNPYHWLVLTSANGVAAFWERLVVLGFDSRSLASVKVAAIGPATAEALGRYGIKPDLVPAVYTAEGVLAAFDGLGSVAGQRFLLARADIARKTLAAGLIERGAQVDEIPAYRTVPVEQGVTPPAADIVTFTSSSTVQGYVNCLAGRAPAELLADTQVVCIGPITAATARELQVPITAVAAEYTIAGLLSALKKISEET